MFNISTELSDLGVNVESDKESMKKMFPNLMKELENGESKVKIDSLRADADQAEKTLTDSEAITTSETEVEQPDKFRHFNPTIVDFIRRCDTHAQAEEIVAYLLKRGEITEECAEEVRTQLAKDGVRSFGSKKEENYYFKQGGIS